MVEADLERAEERAESGEKYVPFSIVFVFDWRKKAKLLNNFNINCLF